MIMKHPLNYLSDSYFSCLSLIEANNLDTTYRAAYSASSSDFVSDYEASLNIF